MLRSGADLLQNPGDHGTLLPALSSSGFALKSNCREPKRGYRQLFSAFFLFLGDFLKFHISAAGFIYNIGLWPCLIKRYARQTASEGVEARRQVKAA